MSIKISMEQWWNGVTILTGEDRITCSNVTSSKTNFIGPNKPELHLKIQSVPRRKHSISATKASQLILYREIIAVCSEIHTKHINTLCGQNAELLNVKLSVHIVTTGLNWGK
jgi:hypothetical protein